MVTMDEVMGAANRAKPTIPGLDTRNVLNGWCIWDQGRMRFRFVVMVEHRGPFPPWENGKRRFGDFILSCYVQDKIHHERAIPFT